MLLRGTLTLGFKTTRGRSGFTVLLVSGICMVVTVEGVLSSVEGSARFSLAVIESGAFDGE